MASTAWKVCHVRADSQGRVYGDQHCHPQMRMAAWRPLKLCHRDRGPQIPLGSYHPERVSHKVWVSRPREGRCACL